MANIKIYDASEVTATFMGFLVDSGLGEGEFIKIEFESDAFTDKVGADGEVIRSKTSDKRVTITVTLLQTSEANSKFAAVAVADDLAANGAGVGPFLVKDRSGTALHAGACWVAKQPDVMYAKEATERQWKLRGVSDVSFPGGS